MPPRLPSEQVPPPDPDPVGDGIAPTPAPPRPGRHRKRVTTDAPPGTDPTPSSESPRHALDENDQRLRDEKPPHY